MMDRKEEFTSHDERRVADLIGGLGRVDAPGDFEPRVRARIAARRDETPRRSWTLVLAMMGAVAVVVAVVVGLRTLSPPDAPSVSQVSAPVAVPANDAPLSTTDTPAATQPTATNSDVVAEQRPSAPTATQPSNTGGGSIDEASRDVKRLFPRGVDPRQANTADIRGVDRKTVLPIATVLSGLGIDATWEGAGWRVNSVGSGSVPARSGLRTGDVIEAIDGKTVNDKTSFTGGFSGKELRVRRDGASVDIMFKP